MKKKFTDGPWVVVDNAWHTKTVVASNCEVAQIHIPSDVTEDTQDEFEEQCLENAKLIAAAPALLEALETIVFMKDPAPANEYIAAIDNAMAVIKKARGL